MSELVEVKLLVDKTIYGYDRHRGDILPGIRRVVAERWFQEGICELIIPGVEEETQENESVHSSDT